ncbi:MAG: hypothetical protein EXS05_13685 [Planctomycetaceae bacterium]|nr:hypothetical protein [Planctomycetaceae bacterium]
MFWLLVAATASAEIRPDFRMHADPELTLPQPAMVFSDSLKPIWIEALSRPEADLQRQAAETIAQGHLLGVVGLAAAEPRLVEIIAAEKTHPLARFAAARALIALDAQTSAPGLFAASQKSNSELRQLIEPVLARWKFEPIKAVWRQRLETKAVRHLDLLLAIRGIDVSGDQTAVPALVAIVQDAQRSAPVRLAAAQTAGRLMTQGLESDAQRLTPSPSVPLLRRLCAVELLARHESPAAQAILLRLALDSEPSVIAAAMGRLFAIDPELVVPLAEAAMHNRDANVRQQGVNAWVALPTPERITFVAGLLDDMHTGVRANVCQALFELTQTPELDKVIRATATRVLAGDSWRGQEQAALLLGALDHKPAASRLVQLLESTRGEVMVASAWSLRKLAVLETLPAILDKATRQSDLRKKEVAPLALDPQVAHLCEAMGLMKFMAAEPLLKRYIPKDYMMGELSRSAAIWSLGLLHAGEPDAPLARQLIERLIDPPAAIPPEMHMVRTMSAISLGRMRSGSQLNSMRKFYEVILGNNYATFAIRWGVHEITGEWLADPPPPTESRSGWFLESLDEFFGASPLPASNAP